MCSKDENSVKHEAEVYALREKIRDLERVQVAAEALIGSLHVDRHDWEDWPQDSKKAVEGLQAAVAIVSIKSASTAFRDKNKAICEEPCGKCSRLKYHTQKCQ